MPAHVVGMGATYDRVDYQTPYVIVGADPFTNPAHQRSRLAVDVTESWVPDHGP